MFMCALQCGRGLEQTPADLVCVGLRGPGRQQWCDCKATQLHLLAVCWARRVEVSVVGLGARGGWLWALLCCCHALGCRGLPRWRCVHYMTYHSRCTLGQCFFP